MVITNVILSVMDGKDIKELRKRLNLSQMALAIKLGVNQVSVNRWENNKRKPSQLAVRQLERLARKN